MKKCPYCAELIQVTCPPKTDPEVMLGSVHIGGRKDGKARIVAKA